MSSAKEKKSTTKVTRPFHAALEAANERLAAAIKDRALCNEKLAFLNVEIPSLEATITALSNQVKPRVVHTALPNTTPQRMMQLPSNVGHEVHSPLTEAERIRQTVLGDDDE